MKRKAKSDRKKVGVLPETGERNSAKPVLRYDGGHFNLIVRATQKYVCMESMCAWRGCIEALLFMCSAHQWSTVVDRRHVFDFVHSKNAGCC
jgi:hypothetical protein